MPNWLTKALNSRQIPLHCTIEPTLQTGCTIFSLNAPLHHESKHACNICIPAIDAIIGAVGAYTELMRLHCSSDRWCLPFPARHSLYYCVFVCVLGTFFALSSCCYLYSLLIPAPNKLVPVGTYLLLLTIHFKETNILSWFLTFILRKLKSQSIINLLKNVWSLRSFQHNFKAYSIIVIINQFPSWHWLSLLTYFHIAQVHAKLWTFIFMDTLLFAIP